MATRDIPPTLGENSFSCPHCGALAHQTWYKAYLVVHERASKPTVEEYAATTLFRLSNQPSRSPEADAENKRLISFYERLEKNFLTYKMQTYKGSSNAEMINFAFGQCFSCDGFTIWVGTDLVFPSHETAFIAHIEMPKGALGDFNEAAAIVDKSPRGAAALLRLCIQEIVIELGQEGDNLNQDIRRLVEQGKISPAIQQALDVVRVVGNNAVHPGAINFDDDKTVATNLFGLVNVIVEAAIATPKHIAAMYEAVVPESTRAAIEKRDATKLLTSKKPEPPSHNG